MLKVKFVPTLAHATRLVNVQVSLIGTDGNRILRHSLPDWPFDQQGSDESTFINRCIWGLVYPKLEETNAH